MKKIAFMASQRKIIRFDIDGAVVLYFDGMWKEGVQLYPYPKELVRKLLKARSGQLNAQALLIHDANTGENLKQYESCKNEEEIAEVIRKDCLSKGLREIK